MTLEDSARQAHSGAFEKLCLTREERDALITQPFLLRCAALEAVR